MKTFTRIAAQGDLLILRVSKIPEGVKEVQPENGNHVVAHSETGHHHTVMADRVRYFRPDESSFGAYLDVKEPTPLIHNRPFDTHEPLMLDKGIYEIRRQREYTPEGYRMVAD